MLAQPADPALDDDTALAVPAPRAVAFGRAQRHSRRVRLLKFALPATAAIIALAFPVYSYLAAPPGVPVRADSSMMTDGKLVMAHPKLNGFTKDNLPYSMIARRAIQDVAKQGIVTLEGIDAKLPMGSQTSAAVTAGKGVYNRDDNTLTLTQDVTVTTSDGMVAKLKSAFLDMGKGTMKTDDPVDIVRSGSHVTSDTMTVQDNGKVLVFEKRVRVNVDPATMKAAENTDGASNAVQ